MAESFDRLLFIFELDISVSGDISYPANVNVRRSRAIQKFYSHYIMHFSRI